MACISAEKAAEWDDVEVQEVQEQAPKEFAPGTLACTVVEEKDWTIPNMPVSAAFRPEVLSLVVISVFTAQIFAYLPVRYYGSALWQVNFILGLCLATSMTSIFGMTARMSRSALVAFFCLEVVAVCVLGTLMEQRSMGLMLASLVSIPCVCIAGRRGRMASQNVRYYTAIVVILAFVQLGTYFLLSTVEGMVTPMIVAAAGPFAGGLVLPMVSSLYGATACQAWIGLNRCWITTDTAAAVPYTQIYCVRVFSMSLRIVGFLPKLQLESNSDIIMGVAGAFASSTLSSLLERTFVFQVVTDKLSGKKTIIKPEIDSFIRSKIDICFGECFQLLVCIACCLPGGAPWLTHPLVWLAGPIYVGAELIVDFITIITHRIMYPIQGESLFGTRQRMRKAFQNWPNLQADGGEAYRKAAEAAKEGKAEIAAIEPHAAFAGKWSQNSCFTDFRAGGLLVWGMNVWWLTTGFYLLYTECRIWLPKGHKMYFEDTLCP